MACISEASSAAFALACSGAALFHLDKSTCRAVRPSLANVRRSRRCGRANLAAGNSRINMVLEEDAVSNTDGSVVAEKREIERRRNLAVISHPDSGKTTFTEKLLLYGGAINQAGAVRARRNSAQKMAVSDWMKMEQERGISITSTVLTFEHNGMCVNILDTPGHNDFSEDTFRTLAAADNVVMLMDAAKGLEPQTRKLFEVARMRQLPLMTFVNKMDRPAMSPYELCDQIELEFGIQTCPMVWPIGDGERFKGVLERDTQLVHLFQRAERTKKATAQAVLHMERDAHALQELLEPDLWEQLQEDHAILSEMAHAWDLDAFLSGDLTPVFFGSAITNFGVELLLKYFLQYGRAPAPRELASGEHIEPNHSEFTGFIFKLQANMDPKHRDRVAYMRIVSGKFSRGMKVSHSRLKAGKQLTLSRPSKLFGSDREIVEIAYPGDVVGLANPGAFAIGDSLYTGSSRIRFPAIPSFSPELFAYVQNPQPGQRKNFLKGLDQLLQEGAVQMLRARSDQGMETPILAAVGQLQYEVVLQRLKDEYGVDARLEPLPYTIARWVAPPAGSSTSAWDALDSCGKLYNVFYAKDAYERPVILLKNEWNLNALVEDHPKLELRSFMYAPDED
ncbi:Peptide chain release factor 3 [Porphyridium purpureum]|uniref:Peptide chain release factor 3 n=1 Tax=Porphyridium purpureum TaxID=35688 RepID=A0A5J4Z578_PORPP|nr:Peptide chain release factor 3 [Porphyridium purpureum]|eukprot:POR5768..scf295_1